MPSSSISPLLSLMLVLSRVIMTQLSLFILIPVGVRSFSMLMI